MKSKWNSSVGAKNLDLYDFALKKAKNKSTFATTVIGGLAGFVSDDDFKMVLVVALAADETGLSPMQKYEKSV